jgi:hypothetical protein
VVRIRDGCSDVVRRKQDNGKANLIGMRLELFDDRIALVWLLLENNGLKLNLLKEARDRLS